MGTSNINDKLIIIFKQICIGNNHIRAKIEITNEENPIIVPNTIQLKEKVISPSCFSMDKLALLIFKSFIETLG